VLPTVVGGLENVTFVDATEQGVGLQPPIVP
jgi:hypothetical protein